MKCVDIDEHKQERVLKQKHPAMMVTDYVTHSLDITHAIIIIINNKSIRCDIKKKNKHEG